jgi:hypothetical protein
MRSAGLLAAERDDDVCAVGGPVHAGLLEALADNRYHFASCFDDAGSDGQAALAELLAAHAGGLFSK